MGVVHGIASRRDYFSESSGRDCGLSNLDGHERLRYSVRGVGQRPRLPRGRINTSLAFTAGIALFPLTAIWIIATGILLSRRPGTNDKKIPSAVLARACGFQASKHEAV